MVDAEHIAIATINRVDVLTLGCTPDNTAYTLWANALALRDIAPFGRNVVYTGNAIGNCEPSEENSKIQKFK